MKPIFLAALALAAVPVLSVQAWAYVPPSNFIVKTLVGKHAGVKGVRVKGTVSAFQSDAATPGPRFKITTVYSAEKDTVRSWATDEAGQVLYIYEKKLPGADSLLGISEALLFESQPARLIDGLKKIGVPVRTESELLSLPTEEDRRAAEISSIARWRKSIAWVIGADTAETRAQLWVEKDTFLPLRLISRGSYEVHFESYRFVQDYPFPRYLTLVRGNHGVLRQESTDIAVNPTTDLAAFKSPVTQGFTDSGNAAPSAVRELIQRYYGTSATE